MNFGGKGLEGDKMASKFNSLAYGNVMAAAAENLKREMKMNEKINAEKRIDEVDIAELADVRFWWLCRFSASLMH